MTIGSIGNGLSPQQILQMLQQQAVATADPEAAGADGAAAADTTGQNLPPVPATTEDSAAGGTQVTPAKASLDPSTLKALLSLQEQQTQSAEDVYLFGTGGSTGDPLLDAISGNGAGTTSASGAPGTSGQNTMPTSLLDALNAEQAQTDGSQAGWTGSTQDQSDALNAALAKLDPTELQSMLSAMNGSATSGNAISSLTQNIMTMLGGSDTDQVVDPVLPGAGAVAATAAAEE